MTPPVVRSLLALVVLLLASACIAEPYDGQVVKYRGAVLFRGYLNSPNVDNWPTVRIEAFNRVTGQWILLKMGTVSKSANTEKSAAGYTLYDWSAGVNAATNLDIWSSGATPTARFRAVRTDTGEVLHTTKEREADTEVCLRAATADNYKDCLSPRDPELVLTYDPS